MNNSVQNVKFKKGIIPVSCFVLDTGWKLALTVFAVWNLGVVDRYGLYVQFLGMEFFGTALPGGDDDFYITSGLEYLVIAKKPLE